ncbi:hypothetical protein [Paenibacillus oryzisoli]|uniref:Uncharacterized protein n=1 Tax=Paenibacillus oryzisoli TaxID=1850517 RepID=A0A198A8H8_9BACL|nr:hypothetical protein [Paenibacillus oryzisoli]OAS17410.1 hypothetical protein A8708_21805 [Paenibacillus oryzisoli]
MGLGDYQFILYPFGNEPNMTEDEIEFVGFNNFDFAQAVEELQNSIYIINDPSSKSYFSFDNECYFIYNDGTYKVEIELNSGTLAEKAEDISVRTNIYKEEGNITEALRICRLLCDSLNLCCWSMKLRRTIDLNNVNDVVNVVSHYNKLSNRS